MNPSRLPVQKINSISLKKSWKNAKQDRDHNLHKICSRVGAFPPSLPRYLINQYSNPGDTVYDPFSGKGTALLEACLLDRYGIGNDICPDAYVLTRSKVRPVSLKRVLSFLNRKEHELRMSKVSLVAIPEEVRLFYNRSTLSQIQALRTSLIDESSDVANMIKALGRGVLSVNLEERVSVIIDELSRRST